MNITTPERIVERLEEGLNLQQTLACLGQLDKYYPKMEEGIRERFREVCLVTTKRLQTKVRNPYV